MILSADIKMPNYITPLAADLCSKLLIKNVRTKFIQIKICRLNQNIEKFSFLFALCNIHFAFFQFSLNNALDVVKN